MEITTYAVMILMQFSSLEACEAYKSNLNNIQNCVKIIRYEEKEPSQQGPLKRPGIIEEMKI